MAKLTLSDLTSLSSNETSAVNTINTNNAAIETALENTLSRDGTTPNTMDADLDMNSNDLLNVGTVNASSILVGGAAPNLVTTIQWQGAWVTATAYAVNDAVEDSGSSYVCLVAHTSGTFATDLAANKWELLAQKGTDGAGSGDVDGPASSTDNSLARFDGTTGKLLKDGAVIGTDVQAYDANNATASSTTTFTNKTFDANGTGNSLSNVDVADLSNGTDGELITWDASGMPTTVAVGTATQVLTSNGVGAAPTFQDNSGGISLDTEQATSSGSQALFSGIPSGTKRITIAFEGVSLTANTDLQVRLGDSGGIETTGYVAAAAMVSGGGTGLYDFTDHMGMHLATNASDFFTGLVTLTLKDSANNTWVSGGEGRYATSSCYHGGGSKSLSGELTQVEVTPESGSFDAGSINITYE